MLFFFINYHFFYSPDNNNCHERICENTVMFRQQLDYLVKYDFKIAGTKESTKSSGNRCIVYIDIQTNYLEILYIYHNQ